jgi:hypothetical protein
MQQTIQQTVAGSADGRQQQRTVLTHLCIQAPSDTPPVAPPAGRPYPITVASIVTPEKEVTPKFFPFEFTPLYVGMPSVASYNKPIPLGGGFVEPLGFNSQPPRKKALSKTGAEARHRRRPFAQPVDTLCLPCSERVTVCSRQWFVAFPSQQSALCATVQADTTTLVRPLGMFVAVPD